MARARRNPKRPCEWCRTACKACCEPRPVRPATHVVKWPEIRLNDGRLLSRPVHYLVCAEHSRWSFQPREVKAYRVRTIG
jgi:hypothetical protein